MGVFIQRRPKVHTQAFQIRTEIHQVAGASNELLYKHVPFITAKEPILNWVEVQQMLYCNPSTMLENKLGQFFPSQLPPVRKCVAAGPPYEWPYRHMGGAVMVRIRNEDKNWILSLYRIALLQSCSLKISILRTHD